MPQYATLSLCLIILQEGSELLTKRNSEANSGCALFRINSDCTQTIALNSKHVLISLTIILSCSILFSLVISEFLASFKNSSVFHSVASLSWLLHK